jgi:hypothetical protein
MGLPSVENRFPPGWDEERVQEVLEYYERQTDEEAVAEDEAAFESETPGPTGRKNGAQG